MPTKSERTARILCFNVIEAITVNYRCKNQNHKYTMSIFGNIRIHCISDGKRIYIEMEALLIAENRSLLWAEARTNR